jgi:hypothetical protein
MVLPGRNLSIKPQGSWAPTGQTCFVSAERICLEYFRIVKGGNLAELTNWLSHQFSSAKDVDITSSPLHAELSLLSQCNLYYTTNYDDFIERALKCSGRRPHVITSEHTINHDRSAVEVVKFMAISIHQTRWCCRNLNIWSA